jgi:hypothetical protein
MSVADFGYVPYGHAIYGVIETVYPEDACGALLTPLLSEPRVENKIALVNRGGCHFINKA